MGGRQSVAEVRQRFSPLLQYGEHARTLPLPSFIIYDYPRGRTLLLEILLLTHLNAIQTSCLWIITAILSFQFAVGANAGSRPISSCVRN